MEEDPKPKKVRRPSLIKKLLKGFILLAGTLAILNAVTAEVWQRLMIVHEPANISCVGCDGTQTTVNIYFAGYSDQATAHQDKLVDQLSGANVFVNYNHWGFDPEGIAVATQKYLLEHGLSNLEIRVVGFSLGIKPATILADNLQRDLRNVTLIGINPCFGATALRGDLGSASDLAKSKDWTARGLVIATDVVMGWVKFIPPNIALDGLQNYSNATYANQVVSLRVDTLPQTDVRTIILMGADDELVDNELIKQSYRRAEKVVIPDMKHTSAAHKPGPYIEALHELGIE